MRNQIIKNETKCNRLMFGKRINGERAQFHNSRRSLLDLSYTSLKYFGLFRIGDCVPYVASTLNLLIVLRILTRPR